MQLSDTFQVSSVGDRGILVTRQFAGPQLLLFDAFTKPELVRRWLLGPPGWTMPTCEIDLRIGGAYRYVWRSEKDGSEMGVRGEFREIRAPSRLVATERFDDAWYSGQALTTTEFLAADRGTIVNISILYESRQARDTARRSGMEAGMSAGLDRLEILIALPGDHMIETPQVFTIPAQKIARIHIEIPRSRMQEVMGPGIREAMAAAKTQGIGPAGPWFTHHQKMTPEHFVFDICVPVSETVSPVGRVEAGERPTMRAVRTVYRGPYEGMAAAWHAFDRSVMEQGHNVAADRYECYLRGPESTHDSATWQTEFIRPLLE